MDLSRLMNWFTPFVLVLVVGSALFYYPANKQFQREVLPTLDRQWGGPKRVIRTGDPRVDRIAAKWAVIPNVNGTTERVLKILEELRGAGFSQRDASDWLNTEYFIPPQDGAVVADRDRFLGRPETVGYCVRWWLWPAVVALVFWVIIRFR